MNGPFINSIEIDESIEIQHPWNAKKLVAEQNLAILCVSLRGSWEIRDKEVDWLKSVVFLNPVKL